MKEHKPAAEDNSATRPTHDDIAEKAYDIYVQEGRPRGQAAANWSEAEAALKPTTVSAAADAEPAVKPADKSGDAPAKQHSGHQNHHAHMAAEFRKRFWISLALTLPILALSPLLQTLVGLREAVTFTGDRYVLFAFSSAVFW